MKRSHVLVEKREYENYLKEHSYLRQAVRKSAPVTYSVGNIQLRITSGFPDYRFPANFCHSEHVCIENYFHLK